jgi:putative endonuclease
VKASHKNILGPPELRVDREKRKRIVEAAAEYVSRLQDIPEEIRFDVIGVLWKEGKPPEFNHIESAFTADDD